MMDLRKAREAFQSLKTQIGHPRNDPKMWDLALGLEDLANDLDDRLSRIEQQQRTILQKLK